MTQHCAYCNGIMISGHIKTHFEKGELVNMDEYNSIKRGNISKVLVKNIYDESLDIPRFAVKEIWRTKHVVDLLSQRKLQFLKVIT